MVLQIFNGSMIHVAEHDDHHVVDKVVYEDKARIFVQDGKILKVTKNADQEMIDDFHADEVINLLPGQFLIPGFIDCHIHAAQFPNLGLGYDKTLLRWLEAYTYPLERLFLDQVFSERVFDKVVKRTMFTGTTTACYSASLYDDTSTFLAKACSKLGQRAFIGKINMNAWRDDGYFEDTEVSVKNTKRFIEAVEKIGNPLVQPIITPRSALTCDMELLKELGRIAEDKNLLIQSHISQDKDEVNAVKAKFRKATYIEVYEAAGFLTNKTLLAHGTCLEDSEVSTLSDMKIPIVHCPTSNLNLRSGLCNAAHLQDSNIRVCLGTDISGGSNYNILNEMKIALEVSNLVYMKKSVNSLPIDYEHVFSMATLGGAKALRIDNKVGNFVRGKEFDALVIDLNAGGDSFVDYYAEGIILQEKLERFIHSGTFNNIVSVYIKGKKVK